MTDEKGVRLSCLFIFTVADAATGKRAQVFLPSPVALSHPMGEGELCGDSGAHLGAPFLNFGFDGVADLAGAGQLLIVAALERGRIGKAPMQAAGHARKYWAALGAGLVANGDNVGEALAGVVQVKHGS